MSSRPHLDPARTRRACHWGHSGVGELSWGVGYQLRVVHAMRAPMPPGVQWLRRAGPAGVNKRKTGARKALWVRNKRHTSAHMNLPWSATKMSQMLEIPGESPACEDWARQ